MENRSGVQVGKFEFAHCRNGETVEEGYQTIFLDRVYSYQTNKMTGEIGEKVTDIFSDKIISSRSCKGFSGLLIKLKIKLLKLVS